MSDGRVFWESLKTDANLKNCLKIYPGRKWGENTLPGSPDGIRLAVPVFQLLTMALPKNKVRLYYG